MCWGSHIADVLKTVADRSPIHVTLLIEVMRVQLQLDFLKQNVSPIYDWVVKTRLIN